MARPPASEQVQVNFRMPAELKARIEAAAQASDRSTTAEIVARLEASFEPQRPSIDMKEVNMYTLELMQALVRRFPTVTGKGLLAALEEQESKPND